VRHDHSNVSYGDNVRIHRTAETERLGIADMIGNVYGETTPSESKVRVIGRPEVDYALNVYFDTLDSSYWLAPQLLEFVNHAPGTEIHVHGSTFKSVRQPDGSWKDMSVNPVRQPRPWIFRTACGIAIAGALLLVWLSLGVGIIGKDGDPSNRMYLGVLCVGIVGSLLARFRPQGLARALFAAAFAQVVVTVIALAAGLGRPWSGPLELVLLNGFFVALFIGSAWLFSRAARAAVN
jgi:hypothetical protein